MKHDPNIGGIHHAVLRLHACSRPATTPARSTIVKVRAALEYAIDRAAINKVVYAGVGRPAYQPFPPNSPGYNKSVGNKYVYDPKKAKAMLAAAGYSNGVPVQADRALG